MNDYLILTFVDGETVVIHGNETGHCPDRQDESRQHVDRIL